MEQKEINKKIIIDTEMLRNHVIKTLKDPSLISDEELDEIVEKSSKISISDVANAMYIMNTKGANLCDKCGHCCRVCTPILIADEEIPFYSHFFGRRFDSLIIHKDGIWQIKKTGPCKFLLPDNSCSIYNHRPMVCRAYPFNAVEKDISLPIDCGVIDNMAKQSAIAGAIIKIMEREEPELWNRMNDLGKDFKVNENVTPGEIINNHFNFLDKIDKEMKK